jgi:hypothetical protein
LRELWYDLATKLNDVSWMIVLIRWHGNGLRKFTVKYVYQQLTDDDDGGAYQEV